MSVSVEEEVLELETAERVGQNGAQSVVAEVEPAQCHQVGKRAYLQRRQSTLAQVEVFQADERRQVGATQQRRRERVAVEVELDAGRRHAGRNGVETAPRAVDDATGRVTEARSRTDESVTGRQAGGGHEDRQAGCQQDRLDDHQQTDAMQRPTQSHRVCHTSSATATHQTTISQGDNDVMLFHIYAMQSIFCRRLVYVKLLRNVCHCDSA